MSEQNKRITRRVLDELFDKGNLDAADELIHPGFVNHEVPPDNPQGPEGLKQTVSWLRGLWGPMRAEIEDEICEGDKVVARVTIHGPHRRVPGTGADGQGVRGRADPHLASPGRQGDRALVGPRRPRAGASAGVDRRVSNA
jgi:SnoaL-like polyketide cyclase